MNESSTDSTVVVRTNTPVTPTGNQVLTGEHIISEPLIRLDREWQPKDKSAQRFKDNLIKRVEQLLNNTSTGSSSGDDTGTGTPGTEPDLFFDTGYMWLVCENSPFHTAGADYVDVTHNLGQVPSRITVFYSRAQEPDPAKDVIHYVSPFIIRDNNNEAVGFQVKVTGINSVRLQVAADRLFQSGTSAYQRGNFRILMWR